MNFFVQKALRCAMFVQSSPDQCIAVGNLGFLLFRRKKMVVAKACISRSSVPENSQHLEKMDSTGNAKKEGILHEYIRNWEIQIQMWSFQLTYEIQFLTLPGIWWFAACWETPWGLQDHTTHLVKLNCNSKSEDLLLYTPILKHYYCTLPPIEQSLDLVAVYGNRRIGDTWWHFQLSYAIPQLPTMWKTIIASEASRKIEKTKTRGLTCTHLGFCGFVMWCRFREAKVEFTAAMNAAIQHGDKQIETFCKVQLGICKGNVLIATREKALEGYHPETSPFVEIKRWLFAFAAKPEFEHMQISTTRS